MSRTQIEHFPAVAEKSARRASSSSDSTDQGRTKRRGGGIGRTALRVVGGAVLLMATAIAGGTVYEATARGASAIVPPAGRLIDVGGYRLHLDCQGRGSPTVVLDAGLGGASLDWSLVQPMLQKTTRVCVYDRAGMGWSDRRDGVPTPSHLADELHTLLSNAGEAGPFVLVGHSLAGKNVRLFAAAFPAEVSGMVLIDARSELIDRQMSAADTDGFNSALKAQALASSLARHVGLVRLLGGALVGEPLLSGKTAIEMALLQTEPAAINETYAEGMVRSSDDAVLAHQSLGTLPLTIIAAEQNMTGLSGWAAAQASLAHLSTRGRLLIAKGSGHYVQLEKPELVILSIEEVIATVRSES
jgi:pimeloyl-ACP methyl ester carboxylesterase